MNINRLSWSGIKIETETLTVLIDPVIHFDRYTELLGKPLLPIIPVETSGKPCITLLTHLHLDHYDPELLQMVTGNDGVILSHASIAEKVKKETRVQVVEEVKLEEPINLENVFFTAVPAMDWRGSDQISWIVEHKRRRILHGGDTIWHGFWWHIASSFGPFDAVFLPVNGVMVEFPGFKPSRIPCTLTPKQAVAAAHILEAEILCPIHYGMFHNPPIYAEAPDVEKKLQKYSRTYKVPVHLLKHGESLEWSKSSTVNKK